MSNKNRIHPEIGIIRPRIRLLSSYSVDEVFSLLEQTVNANDSVIGKKILDQFYMDIPREYQHYWSPELKISAEQNEEGKGSIIRCLIGPRQSVWLMFVFIYSFLGVLSVFGGMYGMVQLDLGKPSLWVWCFPIVALIILGVYGIAQIGQRKGRDQTTHLISVLSQALENGELERLK